MANLLSVVGDIVGAVGGGASQVTAQAATAKLVSDAEKTRQTILKKTSDMGAKLAPTVGGDFFTALAGGASSPAAEARAAQAKKLFGVSFDPRNVKFIVIGAVVLIIGYLLYKRKA